MTQFNWPIAEIEQKLRPLWPDFSAEVVSQTDSTNTQLLTRIRNGLITPYLLVSETQTQGRGTQQRPWHSRAGDSLMFSLLLPLPQNAAQGMSIATGCSLIQALEPDGNTLKLKWPNDIWYQSRQTGITKPAESPQWRKLAGILIETAVYANQRYAVVGVGININPPPENEHYRTPAGYLKELQPQTNITTALSIVVPFMAQALYNFDQEGLKPWFDFFEKKDFLAGKMLETSDGQLQGMGIGIDANGCYFLKTSDGQIAPLRSTEISLQAC